MKLCILFFFLFAVLLVSGCYRETCVDSTCINGNCDGRTCVCDSGWAGQYCNINLAINQCAGVECVFGECVNGVCVCYSGYSGTLCDVPLTSRFIGKYKVTSGTCNLVYNRPDSISITPSVFNNSTEFWINDVWAGDNCLAEIDSVENEFIIYPRAINGSFAIFGSGSLDSTSQLLSVSFEIQNNFFFFDQCSYIAQRQ